MQLSANCWLEDIFFIAHEREKRLEFISTKCKIILRYSIPKFRNWFKGIRRQENIHSDMKTNVKCCEKILQHWEDLLSSNTKLSIELMTKMLRLCKELTLFTNEQLPNEVNLNTIQQKRMKLMDFDKELDRVKKEPQSSNVIIQLQNLRQIFNRKKYKIVFFGSCGSGKSSLLNGLLDYPLLPEQAEHALLKIEALETDEEAHFFVNGEAIESSIDKLKDYLFNDLNSTIQLYLPVLSHPYLRTMVEIVECQGYGVDDERDEITDKKHIDADVIVYVVNSTQGMDRSTLKYFNQIKQQTPWPMIFILWTHWDKLNEEEKQKFQLSYTHDGFEFLRDKSQCQRGICQQYFLSKCKPASYNDFQQFINDLNMFPDHLVQISRFRRFHLLAQFIRSEVDASEEAIRTILKWDTDNQKTFQQIYTNFLQAENDFQIEISKLMEKTVNEIVEIIVKTSDESKCKTEIENKANQLNDEVQTIFFEEFHSNKMVEDMSEEDIEKLKQSGLVKSGEEWNHFFAFAKIFSTSTAATTALAVGRLLPGELKLIGVAVGAAVGLAGVAIGFTTVMIHKLRKKKEHRMKVEAKVRKDLNSIVLDKYMTLIQQDKDFMKCELEMRSEVVSELNENLNEIDSLRDRANALLLQLTNLLAN